MDIQGQWAGSLIYGEGYSFHKGKELFFDIEIKQENEKVSGTAIDTGGIGTNPDKATINGRFVNGKLDFVKQYSSYHYYENGEHKLDRSRPSGEIFYSGYFSQETQMFEGNWEIRGKQKVWWFFTRNYSCGGTWTMKRK